MSPTEAIADDPSHFLPSEVVRTKGHQPVNPGQPTASLNAKVRSLSLVVQQLENVRIVGKGEGPLVARLLEKILDEADADGTDGAVRQKLYSTAADIVLRVHELHAKVGADCLDLETKRSDTRLKRQMWKDKQGIGKTQNTTAEPAGLADIAALMREKDATK